MNTKKYPQYVRWKLSLADHEEPWQFFGKKTGKRVRRAVEKCAQDKTEVFKIETVDDDYLEAFVKIYTESIAEKSNPRHIDVIQKIHEKQEEGVEYEAVSLYNSDTSKLIGGLLYSKREESLNAAFKAFPAEFSATMPATPTRVAEYYFIERAKQLQKTYISHGKDRNVYGVHCDLGLARFKLSIGCVPYVPADNTLWKEEVDANKEKVVFIFLGEDVDTPVQESILITTKTEEESRAAYPELWKHERFSVTIIQP